MKKLKLFAWKDEGGKLSREKSFVGEVYVKEGKVVVESDDQIFREQVLKEIELGAYTEGFLISPSPEEPGTRHKADDPLFLDALTYADGIWYKRFNGWRVDPTHPDNLVEED